MRLIRLSLRFAGNRKLIVPVLWSLLTFVVAALFFFQLIRAETQKVEALTHSDVVNYGSVLRTQVDRELNALLFISGGMASYLNVYHDQLDEAKIQAILADLYSRSQHVRNLGIAVGYRISYVYPTKGNEQALGVDFRNLPTQWPQVRQAVKTRQGVLAGPLNLIQGGSGLVYRYPIFIDGKYWGILSTVINTEPFLGAAFREVSSKDYAFAIRIRQSPATAAFHGDDRLFRDPDAHILISRIPNGEWEWAIKKKSPDSTQLILITSLMGFSLSVLLAWIVFFLLRERDKLTEHAMYDSLTGLANRRLLHDRLAQAHAQSQRFNRLLAVMYVDLDHFKRLNDTYGHDFGDELLRIVARRLAGCVRNIDTVSRIGGDEFVIVLEEIGDAQDARVIAEHIFNTFKQPVEVLEQQVPVQLSIGIAVYRPRGSTSLDALLKQADIALYEAKGAGRNNYQIIECD